jgi:endonuclease/exonuclease/phosphatase family metal-dependent hydrolase
MTEKRPKKRKWLSWTLKTILGLFLIILLYVGIVLIHGTATDYQPEAEIELELIQKAKAETIADSAQLSFFLWNIGYAGLGKESNFFYEDGGMLRSAGKMVRSPKAVVEKNLDSILAMVDRWKAKSDFILLQEVDQKAKRSYKTNQYEALQAILPEYSAIFATNYKAARVPVPIAEPWNAMGQVHSGLASFSKYKPQSATRYQFPGKYGWPTRIFQLDRCMAVERFKVSNGKELLVINSHNSAYDGGKLKKEEMAFLKTFVEKEYEQGNYVIVGADWNQCPPNFRADLFPGGSKSYYPGNIAPEFLGSDWLWAADFLSATNRENTEVYKGKSTAVTLIDYFLLSPNLKLLKVEGIDNDFECSDHQPVWMQLELR